MGMMTHYQAREYERRQAQLAEEMKLKREALAKAEVERRQALARKIVMVVVDQIVTEIIRPGPLSEERECYDMAAELRAIGAGLSDLVEGVILQQGLPDDPVQP